MPNLSLVPALLFPSIAALGACAPADPPWTRIETPAEISPRLWSLALAVREGT
ncbi:MAG: hypothetical protein K1X94_32210 [Sandaracinaceae bacterium]|nr:hypothetical protein [Sandaracinaceae bacterium]